MDKAPKAPCLPPVGEVPRFSNWGGEGLPILK